jgi:hypothetical protein
VPRASLIVLLAFLASCTSDAEQSCPGAVVATLGFTAAPKAAGELEPGMDPEPALTDCGPAIGFPVDADGHRAALPPFRGSLAGDAAGPGGALCRSSGRILFGTRAGTRWVVEDSTDGAVLGGCGPTCAARSRVVIAGDLTLEPAPSFRGALVEQLTPTGGTCGACVLPCAARYQLTGTPEGP